ncbi:MAG: single-stranded DNA-binding protein [Armatimonadota bacterium]
MVNNVVLVGRLTRDPEMRYTPNGVAVTNFRLAVDRRPRRDQPREERQADFIDIVTWRQTAEFCGNYLNKGALVSIEGRIQVRDWETQDGQRRRSVEVVAFRVQALESRAGRERRQQMAGDGGEGEPPPPEEEAPPPAGDPFADE